MRILELAIAVTTLTVLTGADYPTSIELAPKRTTLRVGGTTARLPLGMTFDMDGDGDPRIELRAVLEWKATRLVMISYTIETCGDRRRDLERETSARTPGARITSIASELGGYAAVPRQPRVATRDLLVYVAHIAIGPTSTQVFEFFVDVTGLAHASNWGILAARVASSVRFAQDDPDATHALWRVSQDEGPTLAVTGTLPAGWCFTKQRRNRMGGYTLRRSDDTRCELDTHDGRGPLRAVRGTRLVPATLLGSATNWITWIDRTGHHADGGSGELEPIELHVSCTASTARDLRELLAVMSRLGWTKRPGSE